MPTCNVSPSNPCRQVEANHVFLLEPLLNAAVEAQAVNRVHRGGQTRPTTVHRFVVRGTIEEDIERRDTLCFAFSFGFELTSRGSRAECGHAFATLMALHWCRSP